MRKTTSGLLAGVASGFLALSLCTATVRAESPVREVTLAGHDFVLNPADGLWNGTLTLTIDGVEHAGTGVWWITDLTTVNKNNLHWFAAGIYDFGDLGSFKIWEHGNMDWGILEPGYRLSPFTGINRLVGGTGAFANARAVLHYLWGQLEVVAPKLPVVNFFAAGWVFGIDLDD